MNYVGQLAGSVLGRVRELYSGVNPATLTGAIDVVVVRQPDGSFRSSPFHVRFGKLGVLHSAEIGVDIEVNGEPVDLQMRLGENGEGFFVQEVDRSESTEAPSVSITIPTVHQPSTSLPERNETSLAPITPKSMHTTPDCDTPTRRQHWVKSRMRRKQDEAAGEVDDVGESTLPACNSIYFSFVDMPEDISHEPCEGSFPDSEEEHRSSRSPSPKSDSELEMRPIHSSTSEQCMEWDWGRLPQVSWSDLGHQKTQSAPPSPTSRVAPHFPGSELGTDTTSPIVELIREGAPNFINQSDILGLENHKEDISNGPPALAPDDVLSPASQEVSLYFQDSDPYPLPPPVQNNGNNDKHINEEPEELGEPQEACVALSLCGGLAQSWDIPEDWFLKHQISYSEFCQNPSIMEDPRLVLRIHNKYYNWASASPIILCMQVFNRELPQEVINQVTQQKMPRNRSWWFSWRRRNIGPPVSKPPECGEQKVESSSNRLKEDNEAREAPAQPLTYQRSLRLTSEQIKRLNLHSGANDVVFSVCTKFQGTCRSRAQIYLWDSEDRIIVSDIDGTVTRSDALGHILPQLGKDWTQPGIVQLYHAIHTNGYNFLYCSARSVGLAELTKGYLRGVSERGCTLPPGPLLLSPSSLFTALHREVIEKAPERFKISCLSDICQLFPEPQPFHAAFGNRPNDVLAYKEVGVPECRIFTVNTKGELTQDLNPSFKSSYSALSELVNVMFPPTTCCSVSALLSPEFSHFSFWRDPLPSLSEEEFTQVL